MKAGCAKSLLTVGALGAAWYTLFHLWFPRPEAMLGSFVCGFASLMIVAGFQSAFKAWRDAGRLADPSGTTDMRPGAGALEDGKLVTIAGRIRATGPTLLAPFSQRACVLYQYDVSRPWTAGESKRGDHDRKAFSGFALTPSVIEAPNLSVRLLGFPELDGFDSQIRDGSIDLGNARAFIEATTFEDMQGFAALGKVWGAVKERIADDDGTVRKDWRMIDKAYDISDSTLTEQIVAPGDQVCAIGVYSSAKGGMVSDLSKGLNKLIKGDARTSASSLRTSGIGQLIGGTLFGLFLIGVTVAILLARTPQPGTGQLLALVHSVRPEAPITRRALAATDAEVVLCNRWLQSIQQEDRTALNKLSATHTRAYLAKVEFNEWKAERPARASLVQGTSIGDNAVVVMRGTRSDGTIVDGTFKLERWRGVWRVKDERWGPAIH